MGHNLYGEAAWPNDILYVFPICILSLILLILLLSILEPNPIGIFERADYFVTPVGIVPEWYLYPSFNLIRVIPYKGIGLLLTSLILIGLFFIPFIESDSVQNPIRRTLSLRYFLFGQFLTAWLGCGGLVDVEDCLSLGFFEDFAGLPFI
jgi:cytochrome b6-f complex subunit 4